MEKSSSFFYENWGDARWGEIIFVQMYKLFSIMSASNHDPVVVSVFG
jgi:hypothetical protein